MAKKKKWTADEVRDALEKRFTGGGNGNSEKCVVFHEVPTGTGFGVGWIDTVVCEMWPSNGWTRRAIEIKVARADFMQELNNPHKSRWAREYYHEFWFASPPDIIAVEELPEGAGLYHTRGDTVVVKRAAARKNDPKNSDELVASLMRSASGAMEATERKIRQDALNGSEAYQRMCAVEQGINRFFEENNTALHSYYEAEEVAEKVYEQMCKVTVGDVLTEQRKKIMNHIDEFRGRMLGLLNAMIPIAFLGFTEADNVGKAYFDLYGLNDNEAWGEIGKRAKHNNGVRSVKAAAEIKKIVSRMMREVVKIEGTEHEHL